MIGRRIMYAVVQCNSTQDVKNTSYGRSLGTNIIKLTEQEEQDMLKGKKLVKNILLNGML
jgi:hypothetical protein